MTREELIQEMIEKFGNGCTVPIVFRTNIPEVADFILSREKLLLEKIGKPLMEVKNKGNGEADYEDWAQCVHAINEALEIIGKEGYV